MMELGDNPQMRQPFTYRMCFGKSSGKRAACCGCEIRKQCEAVV